MKTPNKGNPEPSHNVPDRGISVEMFQAFQPRIMTAANAEQILERIFG